MNGINSRSSFPASILEKSRMSLMTPSKASADNFDHTQVFALLGGELGFEGQLGHAHDTIHGSANLMAHVGQKLTLRGVSRYRGVLSAL